MVREAMWGKGKVLTLLVTGALSIAAALWAADTKPAPTATQSAAASAPAEIAALPLTTEIRPEMAKLPPAPNLPKTLDDLKAIQARVEAVARLAVPATVSIWLDAEPAQGSGVIVSKDGYVLTAGHVSGTPGDTMRIVLADGRRVHARAMGANNDIDSGLVKIVEKGDYPFVPIGSSSSLTAGEWLVALGHPGGYVRGRPPVVRLGRVLLANKNFIATDCPLISGDSGGPLFDLDGKLVGINSRIGPTTNSNVHVPIDSFAHDWQRLAKGDEWGGGEGFFGRPRWGAVREAVLGLTAKGEDRGARVTKVNAGEAAEKAGLLPGDIITAFNGQTVKGSEDLAEAVSRQRPGDSVKLTILRDAKSREISVILESSFRRR